MTTHEYLNLIDDVIEKGKYNADWSSLSKHKVPEWYMHDKLGVKEKTSLRCIFLFQLHHQ